MSEAWRQSTWGDEISLEYGKAIRGYQDAVAPYRVFGSNGPIGWSENAIAQGPGVILGRKGAYRGVHFSHDPFFVIDTAYYVKPKSDMDMRWLYYAIIHHKLGEIDDGSPIPSTTRAAVYVRDVEVPPIPEQRAIAATLGALDDKIELNRKMNATLEAMARALFRDWFVDFGPTRAKMEGRAPYLSPDLWSLFPARLDDEGKPEGWAMGTLNDLASLNAESWTARNAPAQVAYVDLANTKWGSIDKVEDYAWDDAPSRARRILRAGDTIVGTVRPGNGSFSYVGEDGLTGSTGFAVLRPLHPRDRAFVWCAATSTENIDRLAHLADGGAYPAVRPDAVAATEAVIPGAGVLEAFRGAVSTNLDLMEANKTESRTLAQTRDLLLPRLMSGELRVADLASFDQEAVA